LQIGFISKQAIHSYFVDVGFLGNMGNGTLEAVGGKFRDGRSKDFLFRALPFLHA
jgi:hypothetical protein